MQAAQVSDSLRARSSSIRGYLVLLLIFLGVAAWGWIALQDQDRSGTWILGRYRTRWFLLNSVWTYFTVWFALWIVLRLGKRACLRLVVLHVVLGLVVGALEVGSMVGLVDFRTVGSSPARRTEERELRLRWVTAPHTKWEGLVAPNIARDLGAPAEPIRISVECDSFGLRNPPGKGEPEVLCLGDSMLVAMMIPVEQILTERLQQELGRVVLNVSESAYSPQEELIRLDTVQIDLAGKLVLHFLFEGNDLVDSRRWRKWCETPVSADWPNSGLLSVLLDGLRWPSTGLAQRRRGRFGPSRADVYFLYDGDRVTKSMSEMPAILDAVTEASDRITRAGGTYAVVVIPMKWGVLHAYCTWPEDSDLGTPETWKSPFAEALRVVCASAEIPFFDTAPLLRAEAASGRLLYFGADTHLNAHGHRVIAAGLATWVEGLLSGE